MGSMDLNHHLAQPFRVWLGGRGGTKASLMLGTRVGSMDLNHHLTQPFRVWLGVGEGTKVFMFLCTQKHCSFIACHLKHCTLNISVSDRTDSALSGLFGRAPGKRLTCNSEKLSLVTLSHLRPACRPRSAQTANL